MIPIILKANGANNVNVLNRQCNDAVKAIGTSKSDGEQIVLKRCRLLSQCSAAKVLCAASSIVANGMLAEKRI